MKIPAHNSPITGAGYGYVYVMSYPGSDKVKIGHSLNPTTRAIDIGGTLAPETPRVEVLYWCAERREDVERRTHLLQSQHRHNGEWFVMTVAEAVGAIRSAASAVGVTVELAYSREDYEAQAAVARRALVAEWEGMNADGLFRVLATVRAEALKGLDSSVGWKKRSNKQSQAEARFKAAHPEFEAIRTRKLKEEEKALAAKQEAERRAKIASGLEPAARTERLNADASLRTASAATYGSTAAAAAPASTPDSSIKNSLFIAGFALVAIWIAYSWHTQESAPAPQQPKSVAVVVPKPALIPTPQSQPSKASTSTPALKVSKDVAKQKATSGMGSAAEQTSVERPPSVETVAALSQAPTPSPLCDAMQKSIRRDLVMAGKYAGTWIGNADSTHAKFMRECLSEPIADVHYKIARCGALKQAIDSQLNMASKHGGTWFGSADQVMATYRADCSPAPDAGVKYVLARCSALKSSIARDIAMAAKFGGSWFKSAETGQKEYANRCAEN